MYYIYLIYILNAFATRRSFDLRNCKTDEDLKNIKINSMLRRYSLYYTKSNKPYLTTKMMMELLDRDNFQFTSPSPRLNKLRSEEHTSELQSRFDLIYSILHEI